MDNTRFPAGVRGFLLSISPDQLLQAALVLWVTYTISLLVYRLWFSPIAAFPGPFLARCTFFYEFYHDWFKAGNYYRRIHEMHQIYGPIIRITPSQLHIEDPSFYRTIFVAGAVRRTNIDHNFARGTGLEDLTAASRTHESHRDTSAPVKPFFSRAGITRVEPRVVKLVGKLRDRLEGHAANGDTINLADMMSSFANDVASSIVFKDPSDFLGSPDYNSEWYKVIKYGAMTIPMLSYLPWLGRLILSPFVRASFERHTNWRIWDDKGRRDIAQSRKHPAAEATARSDATVFDYLAHDTTAIWFKHGLSPTRFAQLLQQAGGASIASALTAFVVFMGLHEAKEEKLRSALAPLFAQGDAPTWRQLERVPYLSACIKETLRFSAGMMGRIPRIFPDTDLQYKQWTIPKGTPVSTTSYWMHLDPEAFHQPHEFVPERWLDASPEQLRKMNTHFVPFAKGTRTCLGERLSYLEMFQVAAMFYRPGAPRISLHETDESHVKPIHGYLMTLPRLDAQPKIRVWKEN